MVSRTTRRYVRIALGLRRPTDETPAVPAESAKEVPEMKQTQIVRKARRHGGPGEPPAELPTTTASDTSAAARVLAAIDAAIAS
jgi:hypothetical protein